MIEGYLIPHQNVTLFNTIPRRELLRRYLYQGAHRLTHQVYGVGRIKAKAISISGDSDKAWDFAQS